MAYPHGGNLNADRYTVASLTAIAKLDILRERA